MESIASQVNSQLELKRSFFYGFVTPVSNETQALKVIDHIRKQFPQANHVCFAYVVEEGQVVRASDDGEPKHTAGLPILGVIQKQDLTNVCAVVVREFGGIKLGASGLVRAYTKAISEALVGAKRVQKVMLTTLEFSLSYAQHHRAESLLTTTLEDVKLSYDTSVKVQGTLLEGDVDSFIKQLSEVCGMKVEAFTLEKITTYR